MKVSTSFQLDTRRETKVGYPVKLRITYDRKSRLYGTDIYLTKLDFEKLKSLNSRGGLRKVKDRLNVMTKKADEVSELLGDRFTFEAFKDKYFAKPMRTDVVGVFNEIIEEMRSEDRIGNATAYTTARESFVKFVGTNRVIVFLDVTKKWLMKYQKYMEQQDRSLTTIGVYTRSLRAVYNRAIEKGIVPSELYPFGKGGYKIPSSANIKKALKQDELQLIFDYKTKKDTWEEVAKDMWVFSYLCNGANIKDICRLKHKNIDKKSIRFVRAKTERSTIMNQKNILVSILPEIKRIIKKQGTISLNPEGYVFPFLIGKEGAEAEFKAVRQVTKNINTYMGRIGKSLGIDSKITTYTARHSFATILKRGGVPTEFISESLGHKDLKTTENYLDSFEDDTREKYADLLTNFKS